MGNKDLKIIVCQHGSRRRYAVARMFEKHNSLVSLYTDSNNRSVLGKIAKLVVVFFDFKPLKRLVNRKVLGVPKSKVYSCDKVHVVELIQRFLGAQRSGLDLYEQRNSILSKKMISWGLKDANVVYSMYRENIEFLRWAKNNNLKIAIDVFISPETSDVIALEQLKYPEWRSDEDIINSGKLRNLWEEVVEVSDLLICPSQWVADGVIKLTPDALNKVRVVPYGCSINYNGKKNIPVTGRFFFAGGDPLRKGLRYLAIATSNLKEQGFDLDVRVAGNLPDNVINDPINKDLNFLGKLESNQMVEEFLSAYCFVLPSLSEGFAGVVAEAIGAGCPVIVTHESGTPIKNGREGLVVKSMSSQDLQEAMLQMLKDSNFRNRCSDNCIEEAGFYQESEWSNRLFATIKEIL